MKEKKILPPPSFFIFFTRSIEEEIGYHNRGGHQPGCLGGSGSIAIGNGRMEARTIMSGQKVYTLSGV